MKRTKETAVNATGPDYSHVFAVAIRFLSTFMPVTLAKRFLSIILIAAGIEVARITMWTGYCERSVRGLKKDMETKDISELLTISGGGRKSKVDGYEDQIIAELDRGNYHTHKQIANMIYEKFGLVISPSAVGRFLKKNGFRKLKGGSLPAKADPKKQREFHDTILMPLLKKAKEGVARVLFADASHFVMGSDFVGSVYCRERRYIKTFSGRKRYNVLGAIDYISKEVLTIANDTYITATEICELLKKIAKKYPGEEIYIVLDNARYQKCKLVSELASSLGINLVYIPPYSPNLNLIERLWKFVKTQLRSEYYDSFSAFKSRIDSIIDSTANENYEKVKSLIGEKIQLFDNLKQVGPDTWEIAA